jgi:hypothetical protein
MTAEYKQYIRYASTHRWCWEQHSKQRSHTSKMQAATESLFTTKVDIHTLTTGATGHTREQLP